MGWPVTTNAFEGNRGGRGGKDAGDPRDPLAKMTVYALQQLCAERGYPEALGEGKPQRNGDSAAWTADQCRQVLRASAVMSTSGITRRLSVINEPLKVEEYTRIQLLEALAVYGLVPEPGMTDAQLRTALMDKRKEMAVPTRVAVAAPVSLAKKRGRPAKVIDGADASPNR